MKDEADIGHNMKLSPEAAARFAEYCEMEADAKRRQSEASDAIDTAQQDKVEARWDELEAYWLQGEEIYNATQEFKKANGKPMPVTQVVHMFNGLPQSDRLRSAQRRVKFYKDKEVSELIKKRQQGGSVVVFLETIENKLTKIQGTAKQQKRRQEKRKIRQALEDRSNEVLFTTQAIIDGGNARKFAAIAELAERGEDAESEQAWAQVERLTDEHNMAVVKRAKEEEYSPQYSITPEEFVEAAKKAKKREDGKNTAVMNRTQKTKLRALLLQHYQTMEREEFIDWIVENIQDLQRV